MRMLSAMATAFRTKQSNVLRRIFGTTTEPLNEHGDPYFLLRISSLFQAINVIFECQKYVTLKFCQKHNFVCNAVCFIEEVYIDVNAAYW